MAAKEFLSQNQIPYTEIDLTKQPEKEDDLKRYTGTKIVPAFVINKGRFAGLFSKPKIYIGFEANLEILQKILLQK